MGRSERRRTRDQQWWPGKERVNRIDARIQRERRQRPGQQIPDEWSRWPSAPQVSYDETSITVAWPAVSVADGTPVAYALYRPGTPIVALTPTPVAEPSFADRAIAWGEERCYEVRAVTTVDRVRVESAASPSACVTLRDTFAPPQPEGLVGVGSDGAVSLIWTASTASDLAGYLVLRAVAPATELVPVTPAPIPDTNFRDTVPSGARVTYAVQAVDKAGNRSRPSASIAETAR